MVGVRLLPGCDSLSKASHKSNGYMRAIACDCSCVSWDIQWARLVVSRPLHFVEGLSYYTFCRGEKSVVKTVRQSFS